MRDFAVRKRATVLVRLPLQRLEHVVGFGFALAPSSQDVDVEVSHGELNRVSTAVPAVANLGAIPAAVARQRQVWEPDCMSDCVAVAVDPREIQRCEAAVD